MQDSGESKADPEESDRELAQILCDFETEVRLGNLPNVETWAVRFPNHAEDIRDMFPGLLLLEHTAGGLRSESQSYGRPDRIGPYEILRELGRGGMGVVYLAWDAELDRNIALKVLNSHRARSQGFLDRFSRESKAAGGLRHASIVPVFGSGEEDGSPYYAMQYVPGFALDTCLHELRRTQSSASSKGGGGSGVRALLESMESRSAQFATGQTPTNPSRVGLSWSEITRIGQEVGSALMHAHTRGVLHRDIKPANILLDHEGHAWVTDFGLCHLVGEESMTAEGDIVGTLRYMAPEQLEGEPDERSDIYGLGLVLYELLTRRLAFPEARKARLVRSILVSNPMRPRNINALIPKDLETIVLKATAKAPGERYSTAAALVRDLAAFDAGKPIQARAPRPLYLLGLFVRRQKALTAMVIASTILVAFLVGVHTQRLGTEQERSERGEYAARLTAAEAGLNVGAISRASQQLARAPEAYRGWEWHHLMARMDQSLQGFSTALNHVRDVEFSLDGRYIVAAAEGGVYFYRLQDDGAYKLAKHIRGNAYACTINASGTSAYVVFSKGRISRFTLGSSIVEQAMGVAVKAPTCMVVTGEGHLVIGSEGGQLVLVRAETGQVQVLHSSSGEIISLSRVQGGRFRAADSRNWYGEYSNQGELLKQGSLEQPGGLSFTWDTDGTRAASIDANGWVSHSKWPQDETWRSMPRAETGQRCTDFSADGRWLAAGGNDQQLRYWDLDTGRFGGALLGHPGRINCVAWRADGERMVTGDDRGFLHIWHPRFSGSRQGTRVEWRSCEVALRKETGQVLTAGRSGLVGCWDPTSWSPIRYHSDPNSEVIDLVSFPGGARYAALTGHGQLTIWHGQSGKTLIDDQPTKPFGVADRRHWQVACDARRDVFYVGSRGQDKERGIGIEVWSLSDLTYQRTIPLPGTKPGRLALSPTSSLLVVGNEQSELLFFDLKTETTLGRLTLPGNKDQIRHVEFSPDGSWILAHTWTEELFLVHAKKRRIERVFTHGGDIIHSVTFGSNGTRVFGGTRGGHVAVWDPSTGEHLTDIDWLEHWITSVAFDDRRSQLLVGSSNGILTAYDLHDSETRMAHSASAESVANPAGEGSPDHDLLDLSLELGWRNLMAGDPSSVGRADRLSHFMGQRLPRNPRVAGLQGSTRLMLGKLSEAKRKLKFALSGEGLGIEHRRELTTLYSLALSLTGQVESASRIGLQGDLVFLLRWQKAVIEFRSR